MSTKWTCNANEATCLRLAGAPSPSDALFHPEFTYPIFGEAEAIYGYNGLHMNLAFASGSLVPSLEITYRAKNTTTSAKVDDVEQALRGVLPPDVVTPAELDAIVARDAQGGPGAFTPPGTKIATYTRARPKSKSRFWSNSSTPREYAIFHASWDTPGFQAWLKRAQIFTLFFIEGASYVDTAEKNWEFYTVFERTDGPSGDVWHFVGYTSLYRFWCWPKNTRVRLSQFFILPPYQRQRHGSELYGTVYKCLLEDASVCELTVEDPSESFDGLRDTCDLQYLSAQGASVTAHLGPPVDATWSAQARTNYKLAPRQWARVLEMLGLLHLNPDEPEQLRAYRQQIKKRIYNVNREVLAMLEPEERVAKLHETFVSVVDEYAEITGVELPEALLEVPPYRKRSIDSSDAPRKARKL